MKIYVDELPKSCAECEFCGRLKPLAKRPEVECMHCNLMKKMDKVSEFCPLQQAELNAETYCFLGDKKMTYKELYFNSMEEGKKLFKELHFFKQCWEKKLISRLKDLRDLEISAVRESREFEFKTEGARLEWIKIKIESARIYDGVIKLLEKIKKGEEI